jgi:hypothetical protein
LRGIWILSAVFCMLVVSGCVQQGVSLEEQAKSKCIELCEASEIDLSNGPCLSDDNPEWNVEDWVCDVAHSPREAIDNILENQCREFREGKASHFVEVDPNCEFIKAV